MVYHRYLLYCVFVILLIAQCHAQNQTNATTTTVAPTTTSAPTTTQAPTSTSSLSTQAPNATASLPSTTQVATSSSAPSTLSPTTQVASTSAPTTTATPATSTSAPTSTSSPTTQVITSTAAPTSVPVATTKVASTSAPTTTAASTTPAPVCQQFQSLSTPIPQTLPLCSAYASSSCCNKATAKRAFNWVLEDDGCGIIPPNTACRTLLTQLACAVNCQPNLVVTGINYFPPDGQNAAALKGRPVICADFVNSLYNACAPYSWCGLSQIMTTDCQFLALTTTGKSVSLTSKTYSDTCTWVALIDPISFASNVLGVTVHQQLSSISGGAPNYCTEPIYTPAATATMLKPMWSLVAVMVLVATYCTFN